MEPGTCIYVGLVITVDGMHFECNNTKKTTTGEVLHRLKCLDKSKFYLEKQTSRWYPVAINSQAHGR
jgi:hypothetical protein